MVSSLQKLLSKRIVQFREAKGLSQEKLAVEAGISLRYVQYLEKGQKWAGPQTLEALSEALGIEPWELLYPHDTKP